MLPSTLLTGTPAQPLFYLLWTARSGISPDSGNVMGVYGLQAAIYIGGSDVTARLFDRLATRWKYDGQQTFGVTVC